MKVWLTLNTENIINFGIYVKYIVQLLLLLSNSAL